MMIADSMTASPVQYFGSSNPPEEALSLWYRTAAEQWVEALPVGNGRLGGMIFGGPFAERIALNESTLWSGSPTNRHAPDAAHLMPHIRQAVLADNFAAADQLVQQQQGPWTEAYMPLGDLLIEFTSNQRRVDGYRRSLNLARAVQTTEFTIGGACITRDVFSSAADQVLVMRMSSSEAGKLSFVARLDTKLRFKLMRAADTATLVLTTKAPLHALPSYCGGTLSYATDVAGEGMNAEVRLRAIADGGSVLVKQDEIRVEGAHTVTLILSAATSFNGSDRSPGLDGKDPGLRAADDLEAATRTPYETLLARHEADYRARFHRVSLDLGKATSSDLPTGDRVRQWMNTRDPQLATLLFQYGRYLLISSSRENGTAANLQGIWNEQTAPPWSSNFTTNINAQMNYWPAETTNLADAHSALIQLIRTAAVSGEKTARSVYGTNGWVVHHNCDLWGTSWAVGGGEGNPDYATWPMGGAWLAHHLWEHYAFNPDERYLRETAYPLMKGAAHFCLDLLVAGPNDWLVTIPSTSPETPFITRDGRKHQVGAAATMDMALIRELFKHTIESARILETDEAFSSILAAARERLVPYQRSPDGTLAEWADPTFKAADPRHRHVSHLVGVYPLADLPLNDVEMTAAVKCTLDERGDESTGWSLAWKLNLWARLRDGEHAYRLLDYILRPVGFGDAADNRGGVYLNLFGAHPPFQIDGNFGYTAGVAEMLLQSHAGEIHVLPALPSAWSRGAVTGLRARGGFGLDFTWDGGLMSSLIVRSMRGGICRLRHANSTVTFVAAPGEQREFDRNLQAVDRKIVQHEY